MLDAIGRRYPAIAERRGPIPSHFGDKHEFPATGLEPPWPRPVFLDLDTEGEVKRNPDPVFASPFETVDNGEPVVGFVQQDGADRCNGLG